MILQDNNTLLWLWFSFACGVGSSGAEIILDYFGNDIEKIYASGKYGYSVIDGISDSLKAKLCDKELGPAKEIYAYCQNEGIGILTLLSPMYPSRLARIQAKPTVLYYRGELVDLDKELCIAEVGTRNMSEYGARHAYGIAYDMAKAGAVVVSGMAKGVDGMAHRGALDAHGYTVAVLGCGLDRAYPSEHLGLMREIAKSGIVFSEFRPFTAPVGRNFPIRNRIISGLSQGTVVIEAPSGSGALITAKTATTQGRNVFALPGKIGEYSSTGTNELLKDGAKMITGAADILLEYQSLYGNKINLNNIPSIKSVNYVSPMNKTAERVAAPIPIEVGKKAAQSEAVSRSEKAFNFRHDNSKEKSGNPVIDYTGLNEEQKKVLSAFECGEVLSSDQITQKCGLSVGNVLASLTMLEIYGKIAALPGGRYRLL